MGSSCCLVLLCGLPGVGKSTFASKLIQELSPPNNHGFSEIMGKPPSVGSSVIHNVYVCFDDIIPENMYSNITLSHDMISDDSKDDDAGVTWKGYREQIYKMLDLFLSVHFCAPQEDNNIPLALDFLSETPAKMKKKNTCSCWEEAVQGRRCKCDATHIIIIDDNMFYSSMRYKYFQLARKYGIGFQVIHLMCNMDSLLKQNASRSSQVSRDTIYHMSDIFEAPNPQKNKWEANCLIYNTELERQEVKLLDVFKLIKHCLENPEQLVENINGAEKEAASQVNLTSVIHQADQVIRRVISAEVKRLKGQSPSKESLQRESASLNSKRKAFMSALKRSNSTLKRLDYLLERNGQDRSSGCGVASRPTCETDSSTLSSNEPTVESLSRADIGNKLSLLVVCTFEEQVRELFDVYNQEETS